MCSGGRHTNNAAEIEAVTKAMEIARREFGNSDLRDLTVKTDSEFVKNFQHDWRDKWEGNGWRTAKKKPVVNEAELKDLMAEEGRCHAAGFTVHIRHVPREENKKADELAKLGAEMD